MNWQIFAVGKPKLAYARAAITEYLQRIQPFTPLATNYVKASTRNSESELLLRRSEGSYRIALDERGEHITSRQLSEKIKRWEQESVKSASILVGGANGHSEELRNSADWVWSLSKLTLQHELACAVLLEQIYRAYTIKAGLPYHRD